MTGFGFVNAAYNGYVWLIIALLFLFVELGTPGLFFFISFAIGASFSAIFAFLNFSFLIQCWVGLITSLIIFFILRLIFSRKAIDKDITNVDALVGKTALVVKEINSKVKGSVKLGGEIWSAKISEGSVLQVGTIVKVIKVIGNSLIVKK